MRSRRWIVAVWACFLARLLFYSALLPLWEGYDEWAHFSVIRHMADGELLVSRDASVPRDVEASLQLAPVPWEMRNSAPPSVTQDAFWQLSAEDRGRREFELRRVAEGPGTGAFKAYEALQPPLYYWLMTPVLWIFRGLALQVLAVRFLSSLVGSLAIPLVFLIGRQVWTDDRVALGCASIVAVMPGLAFDVARVSNDCLAVVLFTALTWLAVKSVRDGLTLRLGAALGGTLGLGLLTKAYFLTAIPAVGGVLIYCWWRNRNWRAVLLAAIAPVISGWWYLRNLRLTGTLSGLSESVMLKSAGASDMLGAVWQIHWLKAIDSVLLSHLYFGGWSSLTVRSWMYHAFYAVILVAAVGLARTLRRPTIVALLAVYLFFWLGQCYNVVLLFLSKGLAGSMGWYMYAVVGAEVVLCVAGLRKVLPGRAARWVAAAGVAMFALLDLYTVHAVAIPYYTGMIRHRANGTLAAFHGADFRGDAIARLTVFKAPIVSEWLLITLWVLAVAGTVGTLSIACARKCDGGANSQE